MRHHGAVDAAAPGVAVATEPLTAEYTEMALRAGRMGTWRWDLTTDRVEWSSPLQELFGVVPASFPGTYATYRGSVHPEDLPALDRATRDLLDGGTDTLHAEHRLVLPAGEVRWVSSTGRLRRDAYGIPQDMFGVTADVSERRAAELAERRALREAAESHSRLQLLARLSGLLATPLDVTVRLTQVSDAVVEEFADRCAADLLERDGMRRVVVSHQDSGRHAVTSGVTRLPSAPETEELVRRVVETGRPAVVEDVCEGTGGLVAPPTPGSLVASPTPECTRTSVAVVPLVANGRSIGALTLFRGGGRGFPAPDVDLALELGRRAGSALEKARLYTERDRVARILQRSLLPPDLPRVPGVELGAFHKPWTVGVDVGGDFYDVFSSGSRWWMLLGDVCGKGPAAAAVGTAARHILRALLLDDTDPEDALRRLNAVVNPERGDCTYTTVVLVRITRLREGVELRIATGGHLPPLVRRRDGGVETVAVQGTLLGLLSDDQVEVGQTTLRLGPGDVLLLYTDGVTEAPVDDGEELGQDAVRHLFARVENTDAQGLVDSLSRTVLASAESLRDDVALLALRVPDEDRRSPG